MREYAFYIKAGETQKLQNAAHTFIKVSIVALEAEASHAGVELDMDTELMAAAHRGIGKIFGDIVALHRLRHIKAQDALGLIEGGEAQHQDGKRDAVFAQLLALVDIGDGEVGRADGLQMPRDTHSAVAIGIGLDDAEKLCLRTDLTADDTKVVGEMIEVDLCKSPLERADHDRSRFPVTV